MGRKYQLLKDKGTIIIRIKSPLKEESQTESFSRYILLCIVFIKAEKERSSYNICKITPTLAHKKDKIKGREEEVLNYVAMEQNIPAPNP